jgi:large subunit ribosomal protein L28
VDGCVCDSQFKQFDTNSSLSNPLSLIYLLQSSTMSMRARVCDLLGKKPNRQARVVTFSHKRNKKVQEVNLQTKRFFSDELGRTVKVRLSTKGLKTVEKYGGIDAAAKKFGMDLNQF